MVSSDRYLGGLGFHFFEHGFVIRHEYSRKGLGFWLIFTDFRLKLRVVVNERVHENRSSYFVRSLHRRAPSEWRAGLQYRRNGKEMGNPTPVDLQKKVGRTGVAIRPGVVPSD